MNLKNSLLIVAAVAFILFIIKFLRQLIRVKRGDEIVSRGSVLINWILALAFIIGLGGAGYLHYTNQSQTSEKPHVVKKHHVTKPTKATKPAKPVNHNRPLKLDFRNDVTMDSDNTVHLKITVSAGSKVTIVGRNSGKKYVSFVAPKGSGNVDKMIELDIAGPYKVIAQRGDKKLSKDLIVRNRIASPAVVPSVNSQPAVSSSTRTQSVPVNRNVQSTTNTNKNAQSTAVSGVNR